MTKHLKIDFVSDVVCPWCIIGLGGLEEALDRVGDLVEADIHFQPFELNPDMAARGPEHRRACRPEIRLDARAVGRQPRR